MKTFVPNYYNKFKCIADKCRHSCCIGWEIGIDESTLDLYKNAEGKFSRTLKSGIDFKDDYACFKLDGKGRCCFLKENGLCSIILNLGEEALCQICSDHPRFRNFYSDRTEVGLGICCEEVSRIILGQNEPFSLTEISDDGSCDELFADEEEIFEYRSKIFEILQNERIPFEDKINEIIKMSGYSLPEKSPSQWATAFYELERLDEHWTVLLNELKEHDLTDITIPTKFEKTFNNLLTYFAFRHLNDEDYLIKTLFIVISHHIISLMCKLHIAKHGKIALENIADYARMYSCEIEYSDENIEEILMMI